MEGAPIVLSNDTKTDYGVQYIAIFRRDPFLQVRPKTYRTIPYNFTSPYIVNMSGMAEAKS